jgi:hypothetical protein
MYGFGQAEIDDAQAMGAQALLRRKQKLLGAVSDPALDNSTRATLRELGLRGDGTNWRDPNSKAILGFLKDVKAAGNLEQRTTQFRGTAQELRLAAQVDKPAVDRGKTGAARDILAYDKTGRAAGYGDTYEVGIKSPFLSRRSDAAGDLGINPEAYQTSLWRKSLLGAAQAGVENTRDIKAPEMASMFENYANTLQMADEVLNTKGSFKDYMINLGKAFNIQHSVQGTENSAAASAQMALTMSGVKTLLQGGLNMEMMDMPLDRPEQAALKQAGFGYGALGETGQLADQMGAQAYTGRVLSASQAGYQPPPGAEQASAEQQQLSRGYSQLGAFVAARGQAMEAAGGAEKFGVNQWEQEYFKKNVDLGAYISAVRKPVARPVGSTLMNPQLQRKSTSTRASLFYFNDQQGQASGMRRTASGAYVKG